MPRCSPPPARLSQNRKRAALKSGIRDLADSRWNPERSVELKLNRTPWLVAALMFAASIGAVIAHPTAKLSDEAPISLEAMVPREFGDWRDEPQRHTQVINPQTQQILDKIYSQILTRTYVHASGYRIMLSLAYGSDQRGSLQAHKPEVCYPAQGFTLEKIESGRMATAYGEIPVRRLFGVLGARREPVTYWFTVGDTAVQSTTQKKLVELRFGLTGRVPDGLLFRISSIDSDQPRAYRMQEQFVSQLLQSVPADDRKRLSGLGGDTGA
jgi:EpsI family protein